MNLVQDNVKELGLSEEYHVLKEVQRTLDKKFAKMF